MTGIQVNTGKRKILKSLAKERTLMLYWKNIVILLKDLELALFQITFLKKKFIYLFWLHQVLVVARRIFIVACGIL